MTEINLLKWLKGNPTLLDVVLIISALLIFTIILEITMPELSVPVLCLFIVITIVLDIFTD